MRLKESEADIQKTILEYLERKQVFHWRQNSGAIKTPSHFIRLGIVGAPDIFVVKNSKVYALEVKTKTGKQRDTQIQFETEFTKAGGIYKVVRSLLDVMAMGL
jgi:hypothetical protein